MDEAKKQSILLKFFRRVFSTEDLFFNNEVESNLLVSTTMFFSSIVLIICLILNEVGIFQTGSSIERVAIFGTFELLIPSIICTCLHGHTKWLKYFLMIELTCALASIDLVLSFNVVIIMVLPVILSCRYCDRRFSVFVSILTAIVFFLSSFCGSYFGVGRLDMNFYDPPIGTTVGITEVLPTFRDALLKIGIDNAAYAKEYVMLYFIPKFLIYSVIATTCVRIADKGKNLVVTQAEISEKTARISSELSLATDIQKNMLPRIFPPFPEHREFDLFATMEPAKEVGGDFYDFFMTDDTHVALVIADVSGKGVPAALFMVTAKTLIKDHAQLGLTPGEIFTRVNKILCTGNEAGLFVTGWMGIIDITSGDMDFVNAGHNPPLLKNKDGYQYLSMRPGFVLAGLETVRYKQASLHLMPGDRLFLYTDGVTEATDAKKELYGEDRLLNFLTNNTSLSCRDTLFELRKDIDRFVGAEEQFDDITMLSFEFKQITDTGFTEKTFPATDDSLHAVLEFVEAEMEKAEVPMKIVTQIQIALEEMFVNIAHYAYPGRIGDAKISCKAADGRVMIILKDSGIPFDPLDKNDPDITASAEQRKIGGLGIYMVKKTMDNCSYVYQDGMNQFTMIKNYE